VVVARARVDSALPALREALVARHQVEFDYRDAQGASERRTVDPLRLDSDDENWYLRGWDHARSAVRTYRLDRMSGVQGTVHPASRGSDEVALSDVLFETSPEDLSVVVEVNESALPLLGDYLPEGTRTRPGGRPGVVEATLRVGHYHGLKRLVAGLSGMVVVREPEQARAVVAEWARQGLTAYVE
jgi:proteasome accessory factor C